MALASYSDLIAQVPTIMAREGDAALAAYLPIAVQLLESNLNRILRVGGMETSTTLTGPVAGQFTLPSDYLALRSVRDATYGPLQQVSPDWAWDHDPNNAGGPPSSYAIEGSTLTTFPATSSSLIISYYAAIPSLETNGANWLLAYHPNVYLFGVLAEAYLFTQDTETGSLWNERLTATLNDLMSLDRADRFGRVAARVKGPTP
jgi:hypothetical protein